MAKKVGLRLLNSAYLNEFDFELAFAAKRLLSSNFCDSIEGKKSTDKCGLNYVIDIHNAIDKKNYLSYCTIKRNFNITHSVFHLFYCWRCFVCSLNSKYAQFVAKSKSETRSEWTITDNKIICKTWSEETDILQFPLASNIYQFNTTTIASDALEHRTMAYFG